MFGNSLWNVVCLVFDGNNIPLTVAALFFITPASSLVHSCQHCASGFFKRARGETWRGAVYPVVAFIFYTFAGRGNNFHGNGSQSLKLPGKSLVNHFAVHFPFFSTLFLWFPGPVYVCPIAFLLNRLGVIERSKWRLCRHYDFLVSSGLITHLAYGGLVSLNNYKYSSKCEENRT